MNEKNDRICIIGAGGAGTCAALELSSRGYHVDLYEESDTPISKASFVNEGKIHMGFIYAMDKTMTTSRQMIDGALHFIANLKRWIDIEPQEIISTPFNYCVHNGSLMSPEELQNHYNNCAEYFNHTANKNNLKYLEFIDQIVVRRLSKVELEQIANPQYITAAFETNEYAVDPRAIAYKLRSALSDNDKINVTTQMKVTSVSKDKSDYEVHMLNLKDQQPHKERYKKVVNVSWNGMLAIDKTMKIEPPAEWSHRYKFGNKVLIPLKKSDLPSCTMVQGPFGDTVNFLNNGMFLSWYPIGRTGWSEDYRPPEWDTQMSDDERLDVFNRSLKEMAKRIPMVNNLKFDTNDVKPVGGVIYALGNKDVDNRVTKLHLRDEVGIRSFGNYHSVNTGKYTLVPYWGLKIADRIDKGI